MLSEEQIRQIVTVLQNGQPLPAHLKAAILKTQLQDFELLYQTKIDKEALLLNRDGTFPAQLQTERLLETTVRPFAKPWRNLLVFGDNLQFLKTVYQNTDPLIKNQVKGKVKLIYIDPPFATGEKYKANKGQTAYSAQRVGTDFIEFLRRRLLLAYEILAEDGILVLRNAYNYGHYVKIILDEIFSIDHFVNEIIINRKRKSMGSLKKYEVVYEYLYVYAKSGQYFFENQWAKKPLFKIKWTNFLSQEERNPAERHVLGLTFLPPPGQHFSLTQSKTEKLLKEHYLRVKHKPTGTLFYYSENGSDSEFYKKISTRGVNRFKYHDITTESVVYGVTDIRQIPQFRQADVQEFKIEYLTREDEKITNDWRDIPSYTDTSGYPTENSEQLLSRIIQSFSQEGDLVLDFFAGSGTTALVAEKLNRRWIAVDMGKLALFTMQKRLLQIQQSADVHTPQKKFNHPPRTFQLCVLQPHSDAKPTDLPDAGFSEWAARLFNVTPQPFEVNGLRFAGKVKTLPVLMVNGNQLQNQRINNQFLQNLSQQLIQVGVLQAVLIAPQHLVDFPAHVFRSSQGSLFLWPVPHNLLNHNSPLPTNTVNKKNHDVEETVGFHLNRPPVVEAQIKALPNQAVLHISSFNSQEALPRGKRIFPHFGTLAAVFVDRHFDGQIFRYDLVKFAADLFPFTQQKDRVAVQAAFQKVEQQGLTIELGSIPKGRSLMIIYTDVFGNYLKEIFTT